MRLGATGSTPRLVAVRGVRIRREFEQETCRGGRLGVELHAELIRELVHERELGFISFSVSFRDIVAWTESPSMSSQSDPSVNCEMFRNGSVPGSRESRPESKARW